MDSHALTPPAIAKLLRVNVHRVLGWIASGQLTASNVGDGINRPRWRIMPDDLDAFLLRRQRQPTAPAPRRKKQKVAYTKYF